MDTTIEALRSARAVRERAHELLGLAEADALEHFRIDRKREAATVDFVIEVMRTRYPDLRVPFHSRWRHFEVDGESRWPRLRARIVRGDAREAARVAFELVITSVLLDAGAGATWRYVDNDGRQSTRSEGLAMASFDAFASGLFSSNGGLRADAAGLRAIDSGSLARAFQVREDNPLVGLDGRAALLRALGDAVASGPAWFGGSSRVGGLCDFLAARAEHSALTADEVLQTVLAALGSIWPGRLEREGVNLGDVWTHPKLVRDDASNGLVPLHKLSQWLTYSLLEPLEWAGVQVCDLDGLTGLAEYRNGGLLLDMGLLVPRDAGIFEREHTPGDACIVEWRALTVALLDVVADGVRAKLALDAGSLPLASVLEGGTWAAGRATAARLRGGLPPLTIVSDGTVF